MLYDNQADPYQMNNLVDKTEDKALSNALAELDRKAAALEGAERRRGERAADGPREPTFGRIAGELERLMELLQSSDTTLTTQAGAACEQTQKSLHILLERWQELRDMAAKALDGHLKGSRD